MVLATAALVLGAVNIAALIYIFLVHRTMESLCRHNAAVLDARTPLFERMVEALEERGERK